MKTLSDIIDALPEAEKAAVENRSAELIAEEQTLRDIRRALRLTQTEVASKLGIRQVGVSQIENRSDLLISTLRRYVESMGGEFEMIARFPGRRPVRITGLADLADKN